MALNHKQKQFYKEWLIDANATQAAIRAGYSKKTAYSQGQRLLKNVEGQKYLAELMAEKESELIASQDEVLKYLTSVMRGKSQSKGVDKGGANGSVKAQIDWLKGVVRKDKVIKRIIRVHPSCVNTIKELQQWKWKKDEKTGEYLDEPVAFQDDAMAALRYGIEKWRKRKRILV